MKRPSFQFYPSDWLRDTALRSCSIGARGLWIDMICWMHEGNPYGYLKVGDKVIQTDNLARMVGESSEQVQHWLDELHQAGVFDMEDSVICSRRMIRDEALRKIRAESGKLGGNPQLKVKGMVDQKVNQNPTPSSSSSSSSSTKKKAKAVEAPPDGVSQDVWDAFLALRKQRRSIVTPLVITGLQKEAAKMGWTLQQVLEEMILRGWQSFKADWATVQKPGDVVRMTTPSKPDRDPALVKLDQDATRREAPPPEVRQKLQALLRKVT